MDPPNEWSIFKGFLSFQVSGRFPHGLSIKILDDGNDIHRHGCTMCLGDTEVTESPSKEALQGGPMKEPLEPGVSRSWRENY